MKPLPFRCASPHCEFHYKITYADLLQIRFHLITKHDYIELQNMAIALGVTDGKAWRSHGWFVRKVSEASIVTELENGY